VQATQAANAEFAERDEGYGAPAVSGRTRGRGQIAARGASGTAEGRNDPLADGLAGGVKKLLQSVSHTAPPCWHEQHGLPGLMS
jgi:hypothetical protein